jgi:hypothetical protein
MADGWCKPSKGAKYADVSLKVFRGFLKNGLDHSRLESGHIRVKYSVIDEYLEKRKVRDQAKQMADELTEGL